MTTPSNPVRQVAAVCADPECVDSDGRRSIAEPETDARVGYFACPTCGMEFGYTQAVPAETSRDCAVGVPQDIRRAYSAITQPAQGAALPLLQIGRPR